MLTKFIALIETNSSYNMDQHVAYLLPSKKNTRYNIQNLLQYLIEIKY